MSLPNLNACHHFPRQGLRMQHLFAPILSGQQQRADTLRPRPRKAEPGICGGRLDDVAGRP